MNPVLVQIAKDQAEQNKLVYGGDYDGPLFPSADGCLLREYPLNREIKRITRAAGIEHFTSHAFRATFSTRFIEQRGADYKILQDLVGHSDSRITLNLYTHVMGGRKTEAMNGISIEKF